MNNSQNEGGKEIRRRARRVIAGSSATTGPIEDTAQAGGDMVASDTEMSQATAVAQVEDQVENGVESSHLDETSASSVATDAAELDVMPEIESEEGPEVEAETGGSDAKPA
jgi:hypothetical protein